MGRDLRGPTSRLAPRQSQSPRVKQEARLSPPKHTQAVRQSPTGRGAKEVALVSGSGSGSHLLRTGGEAG